MAVRRFQATLTPAAVAANVCAEQSFAVGPGDLTIGAAVFVVKPTLQALAMPCQARVVSATNIGVTFFSPGAGTTPTAAEVYQFVVID